MPDKTPHTVYLFADDHMADHGFYHGYFLPYDESADGRLGNGPYVLQPDETFGSFREFYEETAMEHGNEQFVDLVRLHMGELMGTVLSEWLQQAFEAGRDCPKERE